MSRELFTISKTGLSNRLSNTLFFKWLIVCSAVLSSFGAVLTVQATQFSGGQNGVAISQLPVNSESIRVQGPEGFFVETKDEFIQASDGQLMPDGQYSFEVSGTVNNSINAERINSSKNNARSGRDVSQKASQTAVKVLETGYFRIFNGDVVVITAEEEQ